MKRESQRDCEREGRIKRVLKRKKDRVKQKEKRESERKDRQTVSIKACKYFTYEKQSNKQACIMKSSIKALLRKKKKK